jgi:hypothetical protein
MGSAATVNDGYAFDDKFRAQLHIRNRLAAVSRQIAAFGLIIDKIDKNHQSSASCSGGRKCLIYFTLRNTVLPEITGYYRNANQ